MEQQNPKNNKSIKLNVKEIFHDVWHYIVQNPRFITLLFATNMAFMLLFKAIPGGITNPLSIIWFIAYYIYWCFFYRYYYGLRPYIFSRALFASLNPSGKALLMIFLMGVFVAFLPMLPLLFGFNEVYLDIYERYLKSYDGISTANEIRASLGDALIIYSVAVLLLPPLICKPYLAWISSLRGINSSIAKVRQKTQGNYWQFVIVSAFLLYPDAFGTYFDQLLNCQGWIEYTTNTVVFVITNIIFAKIYDFFYIKN